MIWGCGVLTIKISGFAAADDDDYDDDGNVSECCRCWQRSTLHK